MEAPKSDGNFKIYVNYNARAGRWYTKKDEKDAPLFEITNMTAVYDIPNIKTGWILFAAGSAPAKVFDPSLTEKAPKPGDGFKRGFELDLFSEKNLLGVREFSSTAGCVIEAMNALYDAYMAAPEAVQGKLPVVKCVGVHAITGGSGTNYQPQLEIVGWVDRPVELQGNGGSQVAEPDKETKAPEPAAAAASSSDVEF